MQQAQEPAAIAEAQRHARLGLIDEAGVVEVQLVERVAQQRILVAAHRVDAGEDERQGLLVAGEGRWGGPVRIGQGVPHTGVRDALQA